ncbi:potassium channel family protein [Aspergillus foveolatus]|uniref:potassium channel family protein n=1 Tax=Aspergillus foveolatus TaxID=210207 RepID=UPI003CCD3CDB
MEFEGAMSQTSSHPEKKGISDTEENTSLWRQVRSTFYLRPPDDDKPQDWWFASTAIPLVAATTGPVANLMSIIALVCPWRNKVHANELSADGTLVETGFKDPPWCIALNATSLVCGLAGNLFLLCNFTRIVRYIIALPMSIFLWMLSTVILISLTVSMHIYHSPAANQTFSQGYWSAVISAVLYFLLSVMLMINMLGYVLGHYPQNFALSEDQRTLILQTTAFVVWLAVGGAIFSQVIDGISYADGVYFSDITVLTIGFGDVTASTAVARGLILPYAVIGMVILGLVVSSTHRFVREIERSDVLHKHVERKRKAIVQRSNQANNIVGRRRKNEILRSDQEDDSAELEYHERHAPRRQQPIIATLDTFSWVRRRGSISKLTQMQEERDRFNSMRAIQNNTARYRRWMNLIISTLVFASVWTIGAVVFWALEDNLTYFQALYFGFCCLLTIGYGDFTPTTNAARPFFIVWSLFAVPTITALISKMSDTLVDGYQMATNAVANWTVLPEPGTYRAGLSRFWAAVKHIVRLLMHEHGPPGAYGTQTEPDRPPGLESGRQRTSDSHSPSSRGKMSRGMATDVSLEYLAREPKPSTHKLGQQLAYTIQRVTKDAVSGLPKKYTYEEWVLFIRLIQFTHPRKISGMNGTDGDGQIHLNEDEYGLLNWDWIGHDSPLLAEKTEPEWVLDRLCESLVRYLASNAGDASENLEERREGDEGDL